MASIRLGIIALCGVAALWAAEPAVTPDTAKTVAPADSALPPPAAAVPADTAVARPAPALPDTIATPVIPPAPAAPAAPAAPPKAAMASPAPDTAKPKAPDSLRVERLTFAQAIEQLLLYNTEIGKARHAWMAARDKFLGSFGIYEPSLVGSWEYQESDRPYLLVGQRQNVYSGGVEGYLPTATRYNLGFSVTDLAHKFIDNVNRPSAFAGLTFSQPLLKGLWFGKPVAEISAARVERNTAFQRYRSTLSAIIGELQAGYWKLRFAQDKERYAAQSVVTAHELVADSKIRFRAGKISEVETIEAAAGLAAREAAHSLARMELNAAMVELKLLISSGRKLSDVPVVATSPMEAPTRAFLDSLLARIDIPKILVLQPDYLQKRFETDRQRVARDYQNDQRLPELSVKGSLGYQVTGTSTSTVWEKFLDDRYRYDSPTYTAGVELRFPLLLDFKERGAYHVQKRAVKQAELDERAARVQLENYIRIAMMRLDDLRGNIDNAAVVVGYRQRLLSAEISRQRAGKSDYYKIFEMEEEFTKAKMTAGENMVEFLTTSGQLQRLTGSTLIDHGLETLEDDEPVLDARLIDDKPQP